jgi:predicted glycoside hydrolase/deacetylase ChbG (UPF0249 family)
VPNLGSYALRAHFRRPCEAFLSPETIRAVVMRLITHADDFGLDAQSTEATIACLDTGILTSASIMANTPATHTAVAYAVRNPDVSFGVHLVYVTDQNEEPISDPKDIATLVGPSGRFYATRDLLRRIVQRRVDVQDVRRETAAQIACLRDMGLQVSHVDSHGHIHKYGVFQKALATTLPRFGITKVRIAQDVHLDFKPLRPTYWLGGWWRSRLRRRWASTDHFFMPVAGRSDPEWPSKLRKRIRGVVDGVMEIGVHPGYEGWRDGERKCLQDFVAGAVEDGHRLISWHDL